MSLNLDLHTHEVVVPAQLKSLLSRPLIVGASVSANHRGTASPGRQLALRATNKESIRTIAKSGRPARDVLKLVQDSDLDDRTIVICTDLLFWDSTLPKIDDTVVAFEAFIEKVIARELPLVLGEVPGFFPPMQHHWKRMNEEIRKVEARYSRCVVLPFDSIYHGILQEGFLDHHGVKYKIHELVPDGLHLSTLAGKVLADRIQDELLKKVS